MSNHTFEVKVNGRNVYVGKVWDVAVKFFAVKCVNGNRVQLLVDGRYQPGFNY